MERTVLLHHIVDEDEEHYDWLMERPTGGGLITFRVDVRFDDGMGAWMGERIGDHREAYLDYEGEVGGGRGDVTRVAEGRCRVLEDGAMFVVNLDLGEVNGVVRGRMLEGGLWRFEWEG